MEPQYDRSAPKKSTTVTLNSDLLRQARELGINLSGTLEQRPEELVATARREHWLAENRSAIEAFNARVERAGTFSDDLRRF